MLSARAHHLLEWAAVGSRRSVARDRTTAPRRLEAVLAYLAEHLFDRRLKVRRLKEVFGGRGKSLTTDFRAAFGRAPREYIRDRRCETAGRLLAADELKIWQIAELVGYSGLGSFNKAFSRWSGDSPSVYRRKAAARAGGGRSGPPSGGEGRFADRRFADPEWLRRAVDGELSGPEARELIDRLWRRYPSLRR